MSTESVVVALYLTGVTGTLLFWLGAVGYCLQRRGGWLEVYDRGDALSAGLFGAVVAAGWPLTILGLPFLAGRLVGKLAEQREFRRREQSAQEYRTLLRLRNTFSAEEPEWALLDQAMKEVA